MLLALPEALCDQIADLDRQLTRQAKASPRLSPVHDRTGGGRRRRAVGLGSD
jgi:hypothetical protein